MADKLVVVKDADTVGEPYRIRWSLDDGKDFSDSFGCLGTSLSENPPLDLELAENWFTERAVVRAVKERTGKHHDKHIAGADCGRSVFGCWWTKKSDALAVLRRAKEEFKDHKRVLKGKPGGLYNRGLSMHRFRSNPEERCFAEAWDKINTRPDMPGVRTLDYMLDPKHNKGVLPTDREREVAATVVQWLGSPVGQRFLEDLGYKKA